MEVPDSVGGTKTNILYSTFCIPHLYPAVTPPPAVQAGPQRTATSPDGVAVRNVHSIFIVQVLYDQVGIAIVS